MANGKKEEAIAKAEPTGMERPSFIPMNDVRGTENIKREDVKMPRLVLAQGLTAQVAESKEGFAVGILFHDVTEKIYGRGPLSFAILRADPPRWIEFWSKESGQKGVKAMNVPRALPDGTINPITEWQADGKPPAATKFYDFVIALLPLDANDPMPNIVALSLKGKGIKTAHLLNTYIKQRQAPVFAGNYLLESFADKNQHGSFASLRVKNDGFAKTEAEYAMREALFESLKDKQIDIDRTTDVADADPGDREQ